MTVHQKVPKLYIQSRFSMWSINRIFYFLFHLQYQFRRRFFVKKTLFFSFNILFPKIMPNFDDLSLINWFYFFPIKYVDSWPKILLCRTHGLRTPGEEIAFTARPEIKSQSQIYRYGRSIFCLPHRPKISVFLFFLCLHWVSVVRGRTHHLWNSTTELI
jgi:hypothetical protein